MFCPKCGAELRDDAHFCGKCGCDISGLDASDDAMPVAESSAYEPEDMLPASRAVAIAPETVPPTSEDVASAAQAESASMPALKKKRVGLIVAIVACVVALAGVGIYIYLQKANAKTLLAFSIDAPGYNAETDSKIPLQVSGTDAKGNAVDEIAYIDGDGTGLELGRGDYTMSVKASPLLASGAVYTVPDTQVTVKIGMNGLESPQGGLAFAFTATSPLAVTDAQLSDAYDCAIGGGMDSAAADECRSLAEKARYVPVTLAISAPGYDAAVDPKFAAHVTGTDFQGVAIDETQYVSGDGTGISLMQGEYSVTFPTSPLLDNGTYLYGPAGDIAVSITADGLATPAEQLATSFTVADIVNVSDDQINASYDAAVASGFDAGTADTYRASVASSRDAAVKKAKYHISTDYFEFDIPEYWYDKVKVVEKDPGIDYALLELDDVETGAEMVTFQVTVASDFVMSGDASGGNILSQTNGRGQRLKVTYQNWVFLFWYAHNHSPYNSKYSDDQEARLIDLATGGAMTRDEIISSSSAQSGNEAEQSFYDTYLLPTIVVK